MVNDRAGAWSETGHKKGAAVAGGSKVNREASNRVDRSHSMSRTLDAISNGRESLITY
jgi:hypothetical protein